MEIPPRITQPQAYHDREKFLGNDWITLISKVDSLITFSLMSSCFFFVIVMAKVQLESMYTMTNSINRKIICLDLRQAERQGPLSKQFGMFITT